MSLRSRQEQENLAVTKLLSFNRCYATELSQVKISVSTAVKAVEVVGKTSRKIFRIHERNKIFSGSRKPGPDSEGKVRAGGKLQFRNFRCSLERKKIFLAKKALLLLQVIKISENKNRPGGKSSTMREVISPFSHPLGEHLKPKGRIYPPSLRRTVISPLSSPFSRSASAFVFSCRALPLKALFRNEITNDRSGRSNRLV